MSLRAKIEAVVYAAEEPVTLPQLAALFAQEALQWRREHQDHSSAEHPEMAVAQVALLDLQEEATNREEATSDLAATEREAGRLNAVPVEGTNPAPVSEPPVDSPVKPPTEPPTDAPADPTEDPSIDPAPDEPDVPSIDPPVDPSSQPPWNVSGPLALSPVLDVKRVARQQEREVRETLRTLIDDLIEEYARSDRGIEIREIAGGYRIGTKPEYHDSVRTFVKSLKPPMKLSLQALETLAVIAYKQPVTSPEVSEIRGVDTSGVLGSLISRKLITTAGRKQVIGRPILYKTTKEFLLRFGLKDVNELPSIEEFEKMAGELVDSELAEEPGRTAAENGSSLADPLVERLPFNENDDPENDDPDAEATESMPVDKVVEPASDPDLQQQTETTPPVPVTAKEED